MRAKKESETVEDIKLFWEAMIWYLDGKEKS
jgi:hypothetical protein